MTRNTVLNRWSNYHFNNGVDSRNRVVIPAMASETADEYGFATERTFAHYRRLAEAQVGILFVEYSHVHLSGKSEPNQLGAFSDAHIPGLKRIASLIKMSGALAGLQIVHAGGKTTPDLSGGELMGPSNISVPVKDRDLLPPTPMGDVEIEIWKQSFLEAASRAVRAGFDLVEIHSAHGYGFNQWLSPLTNQRVDQYGQGWRGRSLLLMEVVKKIRARFPKLLLSVRVPGQDFLPGGLAASEMIAIVGQLAEAGIDLVNVSSGLGGWRRPKDRDAQGYLIEEAAAIQETTKIPVIGVGGIEHGEFIDHLIATNKVSFAAVGRAILKDPKRWSDENLNNYHSLGVCHDTSACGL